MSEVGGIQVQGDVGIITIDSPPVNALSVKVRRAMVDGLEALAGDKAVKVIVLICEGRTFIAGADITELGKPPQEPLLRQVFDQIEGSKVPVIAAIHGTALGGGYELALACHHRIAVPSAKVGLPEVKLGLLPGAGGTQRLPRLVGVDCALDIVTKGDPVPAAAAFDLGMIDALATEGRLLEDAIAFAKRKIVEGGPHRLVRDREGKLAEARGRPDIFAGYLKRNEKAFRGLEAPVNIVKAIETAVELPFEAGLKRERELFEELVRGSQSAARRYVFFAERQTAKIPDLPAGVAQIPVRTVGVVGAGTMGGGIAMNFLDAGLAVTIVETSRDALDRGLARIRANYEGSARKGRLSAEQVEQRMGLIKGSLDLQDLADADLIIEAVFEEIEIKKDIFRKLDATCKAGAILASNTSYLDLNEIAQATSRPEWVVGLHFFSPANVMRLLEVVRGAKTCPEVVVTSMALAKTIKKVPVLANVCHGFIANRIMSVRAKGAERLVLEGPALEEIDRALYDYGFAVGPFQMMDIVGHDVIGRGGTEPTLRGDLVKLGRLGQKHGGGFYDYDESCNPTPSPAAAAAIAEFAAAKGVERTRHLSSDEIVKELLYPVVNEAAKALEEGIALRASDIDISCIMGYNWPAHTGGPMFWADTEGLPKIVEHLQSRGIQPADLLMRLAASGGKFAQ